MDPTTMAIADLDLERVPCVQPGTSLAEVARVLADARTGVVVVETEPLAELTEADVVEALASGGSLATRVDQVARRAPQFVRLDTAADDVAAIMIVTGRKSLVVVDEGRPVGLISLRTVIGALWGGKSWLGAFRVALHVEQF